MPRPKLLLLSLLMCLGLLPAAAQDGSVYGVFFYSPRCGHCHEVLVNHWPGIQAEFGDQLRVLFVNVDLRQGGQLYQTARAALQTEASGVPMLIIGQEVLVGSVNIPQRAPSIIRAGLASGGIPLPAIPGLQALFDAALAQETQAKPQTAAPADSPIWLDRLAADPVANAVAVSVLVALVASLGAIGVAGWQRWSARPSALVEQIAGVLPGSIVLVLALVGVVLSVGLAAGAAAEAPVLLLAAAEAILFGLVVAVIVRTPAQQSLPRILLVLLALAGLGAAAYLAYVEVTLTEAVCGTVGNCNAVQQSPYARILGMPVGVLGIVGYGAVLGIGLFIRDPSGDALLMGIVLVGTVFSAYLTFLEPFVIGASCLWCLTSAVVMLMLLWLLSARIFHRSASLPAAALSPA